MQQPPTGSVFCAQPPLVTSEPAMEGHKILILVPNGEGGAVSIHMTVDQADRLNRDLADHVEAVRYDETRGR